jgi:dihydroflavonol-4-reductase
MKRILVTGATGFLGRHVTETLLENSKDSAAPTDRIRILCRSGNPWPCEPRVECVGGDVLDRDAVARAVSGVDVVLHLAGVVSRDAAARQTMEEVHVGGTRNVCDAAIAAGRPRIVVASSSGTIAASRTPAIHTESAPWATDVVSGWPYYMSKIEQERLALSYHEREGLDVVILNPSILLGPGDIRRSSTNDVRAFLDGQIPNVPSGGLNFVDARDAARAFVAAVDQGRAGRRYLICGHNMTIREFFELLERLSGVRRPRLVLPEWLARLTAAIARPAMALAGSRFPIDDASIEMAYRFWYCDSRLAGADLGFVPRPGEETLRDTIEFIRREPSPAGAR